MDIGELTVKRVNSPVLGAEKTGKGVKFAVMEEIIRVV